LVLRLVSSLHFSQRSASERRSLRVAQAVPQSVHSSGTFNPECRAAI
jgi:hypothetical protein